MRVNNRLNRNAVRNIRYSRCLEGTVEEEGGRTGRGSEEDGADGNPGRDSRHTVDGDAFV